MNETIDYPGVLVDNQSIGAWLKHLRETKRMTVAEVASHLRLDEAKIKALEADECPKGMQAYTKGYIRHYAKLMGVGTKDIDAKIASMRPAERHAVSPFKSRDLKVDRFKGLLTQYRLSLLVLLTSLLVIWIIAQAWAGNDESTQAAKRIEAMVSVNEGDRAAVDGDQPSLAVKDSSMSPAMTPHNEVPEHQKRDNVLES